MIVILKGIGLVVQVLWGIGIVGIMSSIVSNGNSISFLRNFYLNLDEDEDEDQDQDQDQDLDLDQDQELDQE